MLIEEFSHICPVMTDDGMTYTADAISIGDRVSVLTRAVVRPGTWLGDDSVVSIQSVAQGEVPPAAVVRDAEVISGSQRETDPALAAVCTETTLCNRGPAGLAQQTSTCVGHIALGLLEMLQTAFASSAGSVCALFGPHYALASETSMPVLGLRLVAGALLAVIVASAVLLLFAAVPKWCLIGRRTPGPVSLTTARLLREWYAWRCWQRANDFLIWPFAWTSFQLHFYRLFGAANWAWSAIVSPFQNAPDFELVVMNDEAYMGGGVLFKTLSMEHHADGSPSTATYAACTLLRRGFVGPQSTVLPGTTIGEGAAVMEFSVGMPPPESKPTIAHGTVVGGGAIPSARVMAGHAGKLMHYKPEYEKHPRQSSCIFDLIYMNVIFVPRLLVFLLVLIVQNAAVLVCAVGQVALVFGIDGALHNLHALWPSMAVLASYMAAYRASTVLVQVAIIDPLMAMANVVFVRFVLMAGIASETQSYAIKSWTHARWVSSMAQVNMFATRLFLNIAPDIWSQTPLPRVLYRLAGAHVGRHVTFHFDYPNQPEMSMLSYGDCAYICPFGPTNPYGIYSHNFGKGYMYFQRTYIGVASRVGQHCTVSPGGRVADGMTIGPRTVINPVQKWDEDGVTVQGNLPRKCELFEGVFMASGVTPWKPLVWPTPRGETSVGHFHAGAYRGNDQADSNAEKGGARSQQTRKSSPASKDGGVGNRDRIGGCCAAFTLVYVSLLVGLFGLFATMFSSEPALPRLAPLQHLLRAHFSSSLAMLGGEPAAGDPGWHPTFTYTYQVPWLETPPSDAPASNAPASNAPASNAPASNAPASNAPASNAPASNAPVAVVTAAVTVDDKFSSTGASARVVTASATAPAVAVRKENARQHPLVP